MMAPAQRPDLVIVAAGTGTRLRDGDPVPKQFRVLAGRSVLARALAAFRKIPLGQVVVVTRPEDRERAREALGAEGDGVEFADGGSTRQESTANGLARCRSAYVMVHDAARPFTPPALLDRLLAGIGGTDGAIPVLGIADTVKRMEHGRVVGTIPRESLARAQTPQLFRRDTLVEAHERARRIGGTYTDDASLVEAAGGEVRAVPGDPGNVKLTTVDDFNEARARLEAVVPDFRVGHGYDTHRTTEGDAVTLCGVTIPAPFALDGHSDADVGLHALVDALLGTCGAGDIGTHFPPSEERWRGAASDQFARHAVQIVRAAGGTVTNADITLVCEQPKIGPHVSAMRARLASLLECDPVRVSVKATTNERIGFVGRGEGVCAMAVATVRYG